MAGGLDVFGIPELLGLARSKFSFMLAGSLTEFIGLSLCLFPFYADEITTEFIRLKDGEKLWTPHRRHLYQLLVNEFGIAHWKVSLIYGLGQLFVGASILYLLKFGQTKKRSLVVPPFG